MKCRSKVLSSSRFRFILLIWISCISYKFINWNIQDAWCHHIHCSFTTLQLWTDKRKTNKVNLKKPCVIYIHNGIIRNVPNCHFSKFSNKKKLYTSLNDNNRLPLDTISPPKLSFQFVHYIIFLPYLFALFCLYMIWLLS